MCALWLKGIMPCRKHAEELLRAALSEKDIDAAESMSRLTLCGRDNEAKRSICKACRAPRWDWQLRGRLAAILQRRDLHTFSLQEVMPLLMLSSLRERSCKAQCIGIGV